MRYDYLFKGALVADGSGAPERRADVGVIGERIAAVAAELDGDAGQRIDCAGLVLAPGFIDVHTHDDLAVIRRPDYLEKTSQGVTSIIVGNCGLSAVGAVLGDEVPAPINLLGELEDFRYPDLASYRAAIEAARPSVNVATLIGHTTLRHRCLASQQGPADEAGIAAMREHLILALEQGALGLSTGLSYDSAAQASTEEVCRLAAPLAEYQGVYATHMRTEYDGVLEAMEEAFLIGRSAKVPVQISHHKCAGLKNWGRSVETLALIDIRRLGQDISLDCYPYRAGSSNLDPGQVTADYDILITWSAPHPEMAGKTLQQIAGLWACDIHQAAARLLPAGAIYFQMDEDDVRRILSHPAAMVGSDGLPCDPNPHPRLWGTFPRVLGHYSRDLQLFPLSTAVHKMTGLPARRFALRDRGLIRAGYFADLVLFDYQRIDDVASFQQPRQAAAGIERVFVNGVQTYAQQRLSGVRAGRFLSRSRQAA